ncbi:hypothetical protein psal_cds_1408 [Pandoravirus salinus]|uniref:Uncharacterized protein n=1 Tax=Pandoravirus salinus TaxID=1349410 RepID=S4W200_9VIRU|nr:hypothetical protein psal_cds_1408 [Pandoravirus salinus]AGO85841.2 hypothetical protein psal_cds_1408 [Pandoravirus salinus]
MPKGDRKKETVGEIARGKWEKAHCPMATADRSPDNHIGAREKKCRLPATAATRRHAHQFCRDPAKSQRDDTALPAARACTHQPDPPRILQRTRTYPYKIPDKSHLFVP